MKYMFLGLLPLITTAQSIDLSFPQAWQPTNASQIQETREGGPVMQIDPRGRLLLKIDKPVSDRNLKLSIWLKGDAEGQWVSIDTKATTSQGGKQVPAQLRVNVGEGYMTTEYARVTTGWKEYTKTLTVSRSAEYMTISVKNIDRGNLFVSSPTLEVGKEELADLDGAGIIRASINVWVKPENRHKSGKISFPIPMPYKNQVPLTFRFKTEPEGVVKSYKFIKRPDGINWLCEAEVEPKGESSHITWESLVLMRDHEPVSLPKAQQPESPKEAAQWLKPSFCVQTCSPLLIAKAQELAKDNPDVETYVRRVIQFSCDNRGGSAPFAALDAEYALKCAGGGSCTSRANLAAALLRIHGIPARTVAHLPTWAYGEVLFTHWLVEYWHPGVGWVPVESTWAEFDPPSYTTVNLAISSIADENGANNGEQLRWVMPGAPEWTMARFGFRLAPDPDKNQQSNWAKAEQRVTGTRAELDALFTKALAAYPVLASSKEYGDQRYFNAIERSMRSGRARDLSNALEK